PGRAGYPAVVQMQGAADSRVPAKPASRGGQHWRERIQRIRDRGPQTRGPHEIEDFVGWEMLAWGPPLAGNGALQMGRMGVEDPVTFLQRPPICRDCARPWRAR